MHNIVIDFSHLCDRCGFGEIARNYVAELQKTATPDLHFILMVPPQLKGAYGEQFDYISRKSPTADLANLGLRVDLWHATDQQFRYRLRGHNIISLLTVHDLNFLWEKRLWHLWRWKWKLRCRVEESDYVTVISKYVKDDLSRFMPLENKPVEVVYNGIRAIEDDTMRQPKFIQSADEPFFFTIGQIREKKNFHVLVPMMQHFPNHLLYISGDSHFEYFQTLKDEVERYGLQKQVVFTGIISDEEKNWMYAHCQAFLFPSKLEGFGIPVLEAMRMGARVFSSRFSSLPEVCNSHAVYFDDYSPEGLAQTVQAGLSGWKRSCEAALAAKTYSEQFSYQHYTAHYLALYRRLLTERK